MKTAVSVEHQIPSNIIFFPSHLRGNAGVAGKSSARITPSAGMKSGEIHIRNHSNVSSQSKDGMRGLLAETREILTRYSGVRTAMARFRVDRHHSTGFRSMGLFALPDLSGPDLSFQTRAETPVHRPMKASNTQALEYLFALKRHEKPPEDFFRDFIEEFHKRIGPSAAKPRPSASKRKIVKRA